MTEPVFLVAGAMALTTVVVIVRTIAGAFRVQGGSRSELDRIQDQLDQQAATLEETQARLGSQSTQLAELHERVDFAERLLAQTRDRPALGPGDKKG